eukprot:COSAG06_NODE_5942_length_3197_cov_67.443835_2_plen_39_part_00
MRLNGIGDADRGGVELLELDGHAGESGEESESVGCTCG